MNQPGPDGSHDELLSADSDAANAYMTMNEVLMPTIEWAEGLKKMMVERGWSAESAEVFALDNLRGQTKIFWDNIRKALGL